MKRPKVTGLRRRESWQALPFLLPSLLGLCLFYLFPLAETVRASFMDPLRSRAVGWGNYRALFQNTAFRLAVRNTCRFLCICIPALLAVSLLCAVLLGAAKRRAVFFKSVLLLPYAIPVASIVVLWRALFSGKGLVNGLLVGLGCRPVDFMGSSAAFWVLIFTYLWEAAGTIGFCGWRVWRPSPGPCMKRQRWMEPPLFRPLSLSRCPICCQRWC